MDQTAGAATTCRRADARADEGLPSCKLLLTDTAGEATQSSRRASVTACYTPAQPLTTRTQLTAAAHRQRPGDTDEDTGCTFNGGYSKRTLATRETGRRLHWRALCTLPTL